MGSRWEGIPCAGLVWRTAPAARAWICLPTVHSLLFFWLQTTHFKPPHPQHPPAHTQTAPPNVILSLAPHAPASSQDVTLEDTIRAARELGLRFHPTRGVMTLGASAGGLPPDSCVEGVAGALADAERLIRAHHDPSPLSMLRVGVAPCSPFSVTDDVMRGAAALAAAHPDVRLHTHLAENQEDIDFSLKTYGCRPGEYIRRMGWESDRSWFAHCVMLDEDERRQFAGAGMSVAHCPSSNLRLASGICPVRRLRDDGVNVSLGVDGSASNDSGNLLLEARLALLLQRASGKCRPGRPVDGVARGCVAGACGEAKAHAEEPNANVSPQFPPSLLPLRAHAFPPLPCSLQPWFLPPIPPRTCTAIHSHKSTTPPSPAPQATCKASKCARPWRLRPRAAQRRSDGRARWE